MSYLYIYVENEKVENALKYGMKLSEYANKIITLGTEKRGITAYLSPKDSSLFGNENYTCLKISTENLNIYIYNKVLENTNSISNFFTEFKKYITGSYEDPVAIICSTILPENIFLYNNILDTPILVENSKNLYYEKSVFEMVESGRFSYSEIYQMLLILGEQKKIFKVTSTDTQTKIYENKFNLKKYTRKSNF